MPRHLLGNLSTFSQDLWSLSESKTCLGVQNIKHCQSAVTFWNPLLNTMLWISCHLQCSMLTNMPQHFLHFCTLVCSPWFASWLRPLPCHWLFILMCPDSHLFLFTPWLVCVFKPQLLLAFLPAAKHYFPCVFLFLSLVCFVCFMFEVPCVRLPRLCLSQDAAQLFSFCLFIYLFVSKLVESYRE